MVELNWFSICFLLFASCSVLWVAEAVPGALSSAESRAAAKTKSELCPEMTNKSTYEVWASRYDNKTKQCHKAGQKGPCGNNMIFFSLPNDQVYGECDCNYDVECKSLIYSPVYDECFFAYNQGHCEEGFWLVADQHGLPACERNLCRPPPKYSLKYQWTLYKGRCERLYKPIHDCKPDEYLWVAKGSRFAACGKAECSNPHSFVPEVTCELGSKLFHEGRCVRRKGI